MAEKVRLNFIKLSKKIDYNSLNSSSRGLERRALSNFGFNMGIPIYSVNMHNVCQISTI